MSQRRILSLTTFVSIALFIYLSNGHLFVSAQDDDGEDQYMVTNVAASANGGSATASSTVNANYPVAAIINGDRKGIGWAAGTGGWNDATNNSFPDSVEIQFSSLMSISEINIVTLQDNYSNPVEPNLSMTFNDFGIRDFRVWYRGTDGQWYLLLNVFGNNKVLRVFKFTSVDTDRIKVEVLGSPASWHNQVYSRIVEVEAWGKSAYSVITEPQQVPTAPGATPSPCNSTKMDPCELSRNLLSAMKGNMTNPLPYGPGAQFHRPQNWMGQLDWNYNSWRNNGSQNKPMLAHALALWRAPAEYGKTNDTEAISWWNKYLDCQTRDVPCAVPDPGTLQYWKGAELFSNTYDGETTSAVIATLHWATVQLRTAIAGTPRHSTLMGIANRTRRYLRLNWTLYALGAGRGPATKARNRFNYSDGPNPFNNVSDQACHNNYNGPFITLAGMRSTPQHTCTDDRGPLLARALGWTHAGPKGTVHMQDLLTQVETLARNQTAFPTENAYGLDASFRGILRRHIDGLPNSGEDTTTMIFNFLQNVRIGVRYHFVGARINGEAGQEARLTLMEDNLTAETAPTFGITYDYSQKLARILFPWTNRTAPAGCFTTYPLKFWRAMETLGWAEFRPLETAATSVFASSTNRGGFSHCKNQENGAPVEETFAIPSNWHWQYHIKFSPTGPPVRLR